MTQLTDAERAALVRVPLQVEEVGAGQDILREGSRPDRSCLVLEGMACTYKVTGEGRRQNTAFHIAGDMPDLQGLHLTASDSCLGAATACRVAFFPHQSLRELCRRHPGLADAFWRETLVQAASCREWVLNVGRRQALGRMAHLLCELVVRHRAAGLGDGRSCDLRLSQAALADALGLSVVHVNRVLQDLRSLELLVWDGAHLLVLDWERLALVADFDPAYLYLAPDRTA